MVVIGVGDVLFVSKSSLREYGLGTLLRLSRHGGGAKKPLKLMHGV